MNSDVKVAVANSQEMRSEWAPLRAAEPPLDDRVADELGPPQPAPNVHRVVPAPVFGA